MMLSSLLFNTILALFAPSSVLASPSPPLMTPPPRASVMLSTYSPFVISHGKMNGIYQDYLFELIQRSGLDPQFDIFPLNRVMNQVIKGDYDFFIGLSGLTEAAKKYNEIAPFHKMKFVLIGIEKKLNFEEETIVIGKLPDTECAMFNKEQAKKIRFYEYTETQQAIKMLAAKRLSALCTTRELFYFEIQSSEYKKWSFKEFSEFRQEISLSLFANKRLSTDSITRVNNTVSELDQKKFMSSLYKKYGLEEVAKQ